MNFKLLPKKNVIKNFLKLTLPAAGRYPRGRAIEVFSQFHTQSSWAQALALEPKTVPNGRDSILPHPKLPFGSFDLSEGEVNRKPRGRALGNSFRLKES